MSEDLPDRGGPAGSANEVSVKHSLITDGLVLAAVPFLGYLLAFAYEAGYVGHFSLPSPLIELSTQSILWGCGSLLAVFFVATFALEIGMLVVAEVSQEFREIARRFVVIVVVGLAL